MRFLLAFVITALAASGGWLVWGAGQAWRTWRSRQHEARLARIRAQAQLRQAELTARVREQELADEIYRDFVRRQPQRQPKESERRRLADS